MDAICLHAALLAALLGSPSFDCRENASFALPGTPPPVVLLLAQHPDAEVRWRARPVAAEHAWACFALSWGERWPWVDAFDDKPWCGLDLPREPEDQGDTDWPEFKRATRLWVRWQIEAGRDLASLHADLIEAEKRCQFWRVHRRYP